MYDDIKIKLSPYLGCSKNLMEFFVIIGYQEEILDEYSPNILQNQDKFDLEIISNVISDLDFNVFDPDLIIKQVYPEKPKILKTNIMPNSSNVVFYSCFDSLDGQKKIFFSGYALRYYETYIDSYKNEYYVPKAFLILSQYPYFTTFQKICSMFLHYEEYDFENKIPMELLIYCYCNYVPSPINNNLILKDYSPNIFIPKLTGYPYVDFDICKIFTIVPIKDFIKIYIMIFLELDLLLFSPNIEKLNIFMYILCILNYPLTDSNYFWHIKSISKEEMLTEEKVLNTTYVGVNCQFDWDFEISKSILFIIDMEDKKNMINQIIKSNEADNISKLIKYIHNILIHKKIQSFFLQDIVITLKRKIKKIFKEYTTQKLDKTDSFFNTSNEIIKLNRQIQEVFYDFVLNILVILYKDYELDPTLVSPVIKRKYIDTQFSEEEKIFLKLCRATIKYNTYFDLFVKRFKAADVLKVSLLFSDEYANLKMKDINKNIPDHIKYFDIMDNLYSLKPKNEEINFSILYDEYKKIKRLKTFGKNIQKNKRQLFSLNKNIIKLFIYYKKNKNYFQSLKKEEVEVEIIDKVQIPLTIQNYFYKILTQEYYLRSSLIYLFSMIFPLLSFQDSILFLKVIFDELEKVKYFQRYFCYILLKSIHKYYIVNEKTGQFPQFILNNAINYCQLINAHLMNNFINPSEEIFLFFKKIFGEFNKKEKDIKIKEQNKNNDHFVFQNQEKDFEKNIPNAIITREENSLVFNYKGIIIKKQLLSNGSLIMQKSYSLHDDYFTCLNFDLENMFIEEIIEVIINIKFYYSIFNFENNSPFISLSNFLTEFVILLKNVEKDLNNFRKDHERSKSDIKDNEENNNIDNKKIDDIKIENKIDDNNDNKG